VEAVGGEAGDCEAGKGGGGRRGEEVDRRRTGVGVDRCMVRADECDFC